MSLPKCVPSQQYEHMQGRTGNVLVRNLNEVLEAWYFGRVELAWCA
jgi:hypothetical protein